VAASYSADDIGAGGGRHQFVTEERRDVDAKPERPGARPPRRGRFFSLPSFVGTAAGVAVFALTVMPSLLPRPWLLQGIISGIVFAVAYGLGALAAWIVRRLTKWEPAPRTRRIAWLVLLVAGAAWVLVFVAWAAAWQNEVRRLVGVSQIDFLFVLKSVPIAALTALAILWIARILRAASHGASRLFGKQAPRWLATALGIVVVALVVVVIFAAAFKGFEKLSNSVYSKQNGTTADGIVQPQSAMRSGSAASLVSWQSLGLQGRSFVARGPSQQELQAFNGRPPKEPIRVYVGLDSAPTAGARAALALRELDRTGAFSRKLLVVMGATGTGWIEPQSADPPEYMYNGDTAEVTIQYSFLPSWISFITDKAKATDAGRALFNAVYARWSKLPAASRPKLIAYGLSLGSFAGQAPFSGAADFRARTDGAYFAGTPNDSQPWRKLEDSRNPGSPEWQPVYEGGRTIRWAAQPRNLAPSTDTWSSPRVAYLQHGSDPVVWWSPRLFLHRPGWLSEPRAPDVSPRTRWFPLITFLQVTVDQFLGTSVANGHGHNYGNMTVYTWSAIAAPPGWTADQAQQLQTTVDDYRIE
jgi:uncharacterized membrane protein